MDALTEAAAVYSNGVSTYDTGSERTLLSTTTIQYSYVYNGSQLVQMTIDTTTDSETSTEGTLFTMPVAIPPAITTAAI